MQITSVTPSSGDVLTPVQLIGNGFLSVVSASVNGVNQPNFVAESDTVFEMCIPQGATTGNISITDNNSNTATFPFTVTNVPIVEGSDDVVDADPDNSPGSGF